MRQTTLLLSLLLAFVYTSLAYFPFSYPSVKDDLARKPVSGLQKVNVTTTTNITSALTTYLPKVAPTSYIIKNTIKASHFYFTHYIGAPAVDALKHSIAIIKNLQKHAKTCISNKVILVSMGILKEKFDQVTKYLKWQAQLALDFIEYKWIELKHSIKSTKKLIQPMINVVDHYSLKIIQFLTNNIQPINMNIKIRKWQIINLNKSKERFLQYLEDIYLSPSLEWHLLFKKVNKKWSSYCDYVGVHSNFCHFYRVLILRKQQFVTKQSSYIDGLFQDFPGTKAYDQFYQEQMSKYFKSLDFANKMHATHSKLNFIQWANDSKIMLHEFVDQMQEEWMESMKILYKDVEAMINDRFTSSSPTSIEHINCSFKNEIVLKRWQSKSSTWDQLYDKYKQENNKKSNQYYYLDNWKHELLKLSKALDNAATCFYSPVPKSSRPSSNLTTIASKEVSIHVEQNLKLKMHPIQDVINSFTKLQQFYNKQFIRVDKHLHRLLFKTLPPNSQLPMHLIYERLRDGISAKSKQAFHKYNHQLLYSWNSIISSYLEITVNLINDLKLLQKNQYLEKNSSSASTISKNPIQHQEAEVFKKSINLIWENAIRKLDNNNIYIIQQWEFIFYSMDNEIQEYWNNMITMTECSHRTSF
ncbi:unnamed protein product [Cunninghamella blakesleeana]